jgi:hypothetical protein
MRGPLDGNAYLFELRRHMRSSGWAVTLFIAFALACSETVGPGTDGPLTFAARVDGSAWTLDGANTEAFLTPEGDFLLRAIRRDTLFRAVDGIAVIITSVGGPGRYSLTSDFDGDYGLYAIYDPVNATSTSFISTPPNVGQLEIIAIDTAARRVAGRFNFEAQQLEGGRRVKIESGVFRVSYETAFP